jgi:hypothetical protein
MGRIRLNRANGCWVDLFDGAEFLGNACRLRGPAEFVGLRVRERDWGEHVESLVVGPTAYVQCFCADDFDDTVFWLLPSQSIGNVNDLDAAPDVDTFRIFDRPPFAYEPGYAAYMLWAASHLATLKDLESS